ncbi:MAG: acyl carrier protein [Planctomycetes bacterium]|nr:acyl carrier protein [Planctomycetota bacterium]
MSETEHRRQLRDWIKNRSRQEGAGAITDDTAILEEGILSSLDIVELVLFIESLRGSDVDLESIDPEAFTSVNTIYTAFFAVS